MSQTYCRPIEGVEIVAFHDAGIGRLATIKTVHGSCVVCPVVMICLRGLEVMREWCDSVHGRTTKDLVYGLRDNELLIDELGVVFTADDVRRER